MTKHTIDLLIVGAGPFGLYGAYYAGVRGLCTAVIDSLPQHGGQITAMYPDKQIFDIAGYPAVKGRDLVDALTQQGCMSIRMRNCFPGTPLTSNRRPLRPGVTAV